MTRLFLALTLLLANVSGPKVCCGLMSRPVAAGSRIAAKPSAPLNASTCCRGLPCHYVFSHADQLPVAPAFPCPDACVCVVVDTLALPESPASHATGDPSSDSAHDNATIVYSLRADSAGFPRAVRDPISRFTSGRDRLTAYSLLLC